VGGYSRYSHYFRPIDELESREDIIRRMREVEGLSQEEAVAVADAWDALLVDFSMYDKDNMPGLLPELKDRVDQAKARLKRG
jgi:hypothetical protein